MNLSQQQDQTIAELRETFERLGNVSKALERKQRDESRERKYLMGALNQVNQMLKDSDLGQRSALEAEKSKLERELLQFSNFSEGVLSLQAEKSKLEERLKCLDGRLTDFAERSMRLRKK